MDILPLLRMLGALGVVLGLLVGALWIVRRFQIRLPGAVGAGGHGRRLELVERLSMDSRRSIALVRRDGREHLLLLGPEGNLVIESNILQDSIDADASTARSRAAEAAAAAAAEAAARSRAEFRAMVDKAVERLDEVKQGARERGLTLVEGARQQVARARKRGERSGPPQSEFAEQAEARGLALEPQLELDSEAEKVELEAPVKRVRKPRQTVRRPRQDETERN
ncbi:MAG: hypothetical protein JWP15_1254 [Alphaproteobacteria bacterium]|nr:hypothetical protein [Alphaproteobacteria bacterium]